MATNTQVPEDLKNIGWIGIGVMGAQMAQHLRNAGYNVSVYTRTKSKAEALIAAGAEWKTPQEIASTSDVVVLMLGYPKDVREVVYENDGGIIDHLKKGAYLIDHTTSSPDLSLKIYNDCKARGVAAIDAPVSGGDIGAKNGTLVAMCGGDQAAFDKVAPILDIYTKSTNLLGTGGAGQSCKCINQITIAGAMIGVVEGLIFGHKAGLNLQQILDTISGGAAGSFSLTYYTPKILKGDMQPGFYVEHFVKDMEIALDECRRMNISLPGLALVHQLYRALMAQGGARLGTQALIQALETLNNVKIGQQE